MRATHGEAAWAERAAAVGALTTAGVIGGLYLGHGWLGLPFVPFDVTDAIIRLTPGTIATAGIEALGEGAKQVLLAIGVLGFLAFGAALGLLDSRLSSRRSVRILALAGIALFATVLVESVVAWNGVDVAAGVLWVAASYTAAAGVLDTVLDRIVGESAGRSGEEASGGKGPGPMNRAEDGGVLGRRSFLMRFAAASLAAAAGGIALGSVGRASRVREVEALAALPTTTPPAAGAAQVSGAAVPGGRVLPNPEVTRTAPSNGETGSIAAGEGVETPAAGEAASGTAPPPAGVTGAPTGEVPAATPTLEAMETTAPLPPGTRLPAAPPPLFVPAPGTRPNETPLDDFYVVNIATRDPLADLGGWRLSVKGLVGRPLALSYQDLLRFPRVDVPATLECISNTVGGQLISTGQFNGLRLADVLAQAMPRAAAVEMVTRSLDGYTESIPIDKALRPDTLLIYGMDGLTLEQEHGYPLRLYNPNHYGMKNPKWLTELEFVSDPYTGYWEFRGWDKEAVVKTTTVMDTRGELKRVNGLVQLGGVAFAGWRGIDRVEVNIDNGDWRAAALDTPLSPFTWVRWRYDWRDAAPGPHAIMVRSVDGTGDLQTNFITAPHPDGASGWQQTRVIVS